MLSRAHTLSLASPLPSTYSCLVYSARRRPETTGVRQKNEHDEELAGAKRRRRRRRLDSVARWLGQTRNHSPSPLHPLLRTPHPLTHTTHPVFLLGLTCLSIFGFVKKCRFLFENWQSLFGTYFKISNILKKKKSFYKICIKNKNKIFREILTDKKINSFFKAHSNIK